MKKIIIIVLLGIGCWVFFGRSGGLAVLPVRFSVTGVPIIDVTVEGKVFPLLLDLGSCSEVELSEEIVAQLKHCQHTGASTLVDMYGQEHENHVYKIPRLNLGLYPFKRLHVKAVPESEVDHTWTSLSTEEKTKYPFRKGLIGWPLLKRTSLLFDFANDKVIATNHMKKLIAEGYRVDSFTRVPFSLENGWIELSIKTELGVNKFMLDTGCTVTVVNQHLYPDIDAHFERHGMGVVRSQRCVMGGVDFGEVDLHLFPIGEHEALANIDGVLGMDFLMRHVVYLDFKERVMYIR